MKRRRLLVALGGVSALPAALPIANRLRAATLPAVRSVGVPAQEDPLAAIRAAMSVAQGAAAALDAIWRDPRFELQLIYTRVDRAPRSGPTAASPAPHLTHFRFGVSPQRWFAPASLVKLPVAALALERIAELAAQTAAAAAPHGTIQARTAQTEAAQSGADQSGAAQSGVAQMGVLPGLTRDTPFVLRTPLRCARAAAAEVESAARAIRRMFVVSENAPFNRLYELLGQNRIHQRLAAIGLGHSRVINRIEPCSAADNRRTGVIEFLGPDQRLLARIEGETAQEERRFPHGRALKGSAWVEGSKTIMGPRDFSERNFIPLDDAHRMLIALVLPAALPAAQRFALDADALVFLRACMGMLPSECTDPVYSVHDYPDTHAKYLLGGAGLAPMPVGVRSFNKVGRSFGYLSDCAYIVDSVRGVEFFLSASLYVNEDDVLNDGRYEYQETGWPFLAALGRAALAVDAARLRAQPAVLLGADGRFEA